MRKTEGLLSGVEERLKSIRYKVIIMSGKGGVGKSFITASLAYVLSLEKRKVGILDVDLHGPSIPRILGLKSHEVISSGKGIVPLEGICNIRIFSIQFFLPSPDTPIIWRGPLKARAIAELLSNVIWGEMDYLLIDLPPGTGDEPLSIAQLIRGLSGAVIITTPSELSRTIVSKAVNFCKQLGIRILGIVENMSWFTCTKCGTRYYIFGKGGGERLAEEFKIKYLGAIPIDPRVSTCIKEGIFFMKKYPNSSIAVAIRGIARKIMRELERKAKV